MNSFFNNSFTDNYFDLNSEKLLNNSKISYNKICQICDKSNYYFNSKIIDSNIIRLRKPSSNTFNFKKYIKKNDFFLQTSCNRIKENPLKIQYDFNQENILKKICTSILDKKYLKSIEYILKNSFDEPIFSILGFISSLCEKKNQYETEFFKICEKTTFLKSDLKHIYHLFDELLSIQYQKELPLLNLILGDLNSLFQSYEFQPHLLQILSINKNHFNDSLFHKKESNFLSIEKLYEFSQEKSKKLPILKSNIFF